MKSAVWFLGAVICAFAAIWVPAYLGHIIAWRDTWFDDAYSVSLVGVFLIFGAGAFTCLVIGVDRVSPK